MGYDCVVCAKQVPDTKNITGQAMKDDGTVNRAALPAVFNPEDLHALETALDIRDRFGGTVTVITMGLPKACQVLRDALYRGADRAILITDRRAAGSDTLATSYILSTAIRKLAPDIVLCGRQAIDGDTAQTGPQIAEKLDFTLISYLEELQALEDQTIRVKRNVGNGWEVVEARLPVLLTVMNTANTPRPSGAKRIMRFKKAKAPAEVAGEVAAQMPQAGKPEQAAETKNRCDALAAKGLLIDQWDLSTIEADLAWCGLAGSPTKVHRIQAIVLAGGQYRQFQPTDESVGELVGELIRDHTIG